tara:strand:+ start:760 stop:1062 length:303 start_codon:yes stop_codon:yes gene_type:complete
MAISGKWKGVIKSPMGPMNVLLDIIERKDGTLEGTASDKRQSMVIEDGLIKGDVFSWVFNMKGIMSMKLEINGTVECDRLNATVTIAKRGKFPLTADRMT